MNFDVVVVLGTHRSGTSALTKALELFGIDLGKELLPPNPENPKGYFESAGLVALNDRILVKCDSHWTSLQFLDSEKLGGPDLAAEKKEARQLLASKISPGIPLGLKDPRLCRTLPFWQELFREKNPRVGYVLSYRHPAEVAASLKKRDDLPMEYGLNLWASYQTDALLHVEGAPWIAVGFENLLENTATELARLAAFLGLAWDPEKPAVRTFEKEFLDASLRHQRSDKPLSNLPASLQELAEAMEHSCVDAEKDAKGKAVLAGRKFRQETQPISGLVAVANQQLFRELSSEVVSVEIFYATEAGHFSESRKISKEIKIRPGLRLALLQAIPVEASNARFWRIDPGFRPGKISIRSLKILAADQRVGWDLQDNRDQITVGGTAISLPQPSVGMELVSTGGDPMVILPALPPAALPVASLLIELEVAPVAEAIDAVSRAHVAHEAHQQAVIAHKQERVEQLENSLKANQKEMEVNRLREEAVEKSFGELKGELAEQREAEEASIRGLKEELLAEIRSLMEKLEEQRESDRKKTEAQFLSAQTGTEGRIKDLEGYAEAMHEAVLSPASTYLPAPFSWYAMLYKMMNIKKPASLKQGLTSPAQSPRPGFWRRLERSIRKRRKRLQARIGFDREWYLKEYLDVKNSGMDPLYHYLEFGEREGRWKSESEKKRNSLKATTNEPVKPNEPSPKKKVESERGTILIVAHDAQVGGAQKVARVFGSWLQRKTHYKVKFALMGGGPDIHEFANIAPVIDLSVLPPSDRKERLQNFLGQEPCAVLINSVASGGCLRYLPKTVPIIAYIHEMKEIIKLYAGEIDLIRERANLIVAGGQDVAKELKSEYFFDSPKIRVVPAFIDDDLKPEEGSLGEKRKAKSEIGVDPESILVTACGVAHWRKNPLKFVEVAAIVLAKASQKINFIWVGHGEQMLECQEIARKLKVDERVKFIGYQKNIHAYLAASDIFLLPSIEDPFPLVCLFAGLASNPIVCFANSGGIPELVAQGGGRIVPRGDISAMADAVLYYVEKPDARLSDGKILKDKVIEENTVATAGPNLFHFIREGAGLRPHISVILPNYNYQRFLGERLDSIRKQSYQDFEVILLDDHSTDGSEKTLKKWASARAGSRFFANEANSGSPFGQWQKGLSLAEGDLVWIAEADDFCDAKFLETLVPAFDNRNVFLAYAKSVPVDSWGAKLGDYDDIYLNRIHPGRWTKDYQETDFEEVNKGLGIANCIPNASSALFRKFEPEPEFVSLQKGMRICGDWLFYLRAMRGGLVSYCAKPLNMHRRHQKTVTGGTEGSKKYFSEFSKVREFVSANYRLENTTKNKITEFDQQEAMRFNVAGQKPFSTSAGPRTRLPSVLFVTSDLSPGGGQMFIVRLANEWAQRGGRAILLNAEKYPDHPQVTAKINPRVALFSKAQITLNALVARFDLEIVHSAIWWADDLVRETIGKVGGVPWVVTMHGCHETLLDHPETDSRSHEKIMEMLSRVDAWVYTAEKNKRLFQSHGWPKRTQRIDNGVAVEATFNLTRRSLGLSDSALLLCLASRAIFEKGWLEALAAFKEIHALRKNVELLLIGEGPAAESVKKAVPPGVKLLGQVANLQDYLALADIVLLPSYFVGESLPLVLLEAMALGKPIVATPVGEIPALLGEGRESAGLLVPLVEGRPSISHLVAAIDKLSDEEVRKAMGKIGLARQAGNYSQKKMLERYEHLYRDCLSTHRGVA